MFWGICFISGILPFSVQAQYKVYTWENFESAQFPANLVKYGQGSEENVHVADYDRFHDPMILEGRARTECGRYGLFFNAAPTSRYLRVVSNNKPNRADLGKEKKAIVQADFYFKERVPKPLGIAVLAAEIDPPESKVVSAFYRLGLNESNELYFSFLDTRKQQGPIKYIREKIENYQLEIPGWHRLQMVFQEESKILCFIDGRELNFSPLLENSLKTLQMGIMIAAQPDQVSNALVDNLSIQVADENLPLPRSPWAKPSPGSGTFPFEIPAPLQQSSSLPSLKWWTTPEDAMQSNQEKKLPYLILFYSTFAKSNASLEKIMMTEPAINFLKQFVLVHIDVNQLHGGTLAHNMGVFKAPCIVRLNFKGQETARVNYNETMSWKDIEQALRPQGK